MLEVAQQFATAPTAVRVESLSLGFSPRVAGHNGDVVRTLAESCETFPPLLVHRQSNRIIDGMHRLLAARARGDEHIAVRFVECDDETAFVLAVQANEPHGLALSLRD